MENPATFPKSAMLYSLVTGRGDTHQRLARADVKGHQPFIAAKSDPSRSASLSHRSLKLIESEETTMEQHLKTDLKVMVLEPGKERPTSFGTPAQANQSVTEEQILGFADLMGQLLPGDMPVSHVVKTVQTSHTK